MRAMSVFRRIGLATTRTNRASQHPLRVSAARSIHSEEKLSAFGPRNGQFVRTLERTTLSELGKDVDLWSTGNFQASVYPDLPMASTLMEAILNQLKGVSQEDRNARTLHSTASTSSPSVELPPNLRKGGTVPAHWLRSRLISDGSGLVIKTVAAQNRSKAFLAEALQFAAGVDREGQPLPGVQRSDGLLILGGGTPLRTIAHGALRGLFVSAVDLIGTASEMKRTGALPPDLMIWCVANPMTEPNAAYLEAKVAAGAEVVLTQPPLLWDRWDEWIGDVEARSIQEVAKVVAGLPVIASAKNLRFWFDLCGAGTVPGAAEEVARYARSEVVLDKEAFTQFRRTFTREMLQRLRTYGPVEGVHVMPTTPRSRRDALEMAREGAL